MKFIIKILCITSIVISCFFSCKEKPTYNPFDNQFNVSVRSLIRDNCDTISAECGYYNLTKREGKLRPYYQIYDEEFYEVVAKGFIYPMDTFKVEEFVDIYTSKSLIDSVAYLPINEEELNEEFWKFGYVIYQRYQDTIQIVNAENKDTIELKLSVFPVNYNRSIARGIGYFKTEEK